MLQECLFNKVAGLNLQLMNTFFYRTLPVSASDLILTHFRPVFSIYKCRENIPAGLYLHKVDNRITRTRCEICSKVTIKTLSFIFELISIFSYSSIISISATMIRLILAEETSQKMKVKSTSYKE